MKRVAIVTLTRNPNFGNVLQNIALQKVIEKLGCRAETIINYKDSTLFYKSHFLKRTLKLILRKADYKGEIKRIRFLICCKKNIRYSDCFYDNEGILNGDVNGKYDYCIVGSDQVWNPCFGFATDFELLSFMEKDKKFSYAASLGIDNIERFSDENKERIGELLKEFKGISVREDAGKEIISQISNLNCVVHIDPIFLLEKEEWEGLIEKPYVKLKNNYVVVYMLGEITEEYKNTIENFAKKQKLEVINVLEGKWAQLNPLEFLWILKNSVGVFTDSFHATAFSILFHKTFRVFERQDNHESQNSRFETLFRMTGVDSKNTNGNRNLDWKKIDSIIQMERTRSIAYISECIRN